MAQDAKTMPFDSIADLKGSPFQVPPQGVRSELNSPWPKIFFSYFEHLNDNIAKVEIICWSTYWDGE